MFVGLILQGCYCLGIRKKFGDRGGRRWEIPDRTIHHFCPSNLLLWGQIRFPAAWQEKYELLSNPELFKNLDFVAYASEITHPDTEFRLDVNRVYNQIVNLPGGNCKTSPIMPYKMNGNVEWKLKRQEVGWVMQFIGI